MEGDIVNRVANSALVTFDLEDFYPEGKRIALDISPWLFEGAPRSAIIGAGSCRTRWTRLYGRVLRRRYLLGKDRAQTCRAGNWGG